jgi:hypothetical protein
MGTYGGTMVIWGYSIADWASVAQIAGSLVLVLTLPFVAAQVAAIRTQTASHRDQAGIDRADDYSKKYDELKPTLDRLRAKHLELAPAEFLQKLATGGELVDSWHRALNYFEDLGTHYCQESVDREFINRTLRRAIKNCWNEFSHIISELRARRSHPELYKQFEDMAKLIP